MPVATEGEYLIMVGPRLFEGDVAAMEPDTLVHEMTHVWQYMHGTLGEAEAALKHFGAAAIRDTDRLYKYRIGQSWDDMGFEGQAQLVQEWFTVDNMSETTDRWVYVKHVLMLGEVPARSFSLGELRLSDPPQEPDDDEPVRDVSSDDYPFRESYLQDTLDEDIPPSDIKRLAARVKDLTEYFRQLRRLRPQEAQAFLNRLQADPPPDKLAKAFRYRLSRPSRDKLINVLQGLA